MGWEDHLGRRNSSCYCIKGERIWGIRGMVWSSVFNQAKCERKATRSRAEPFVIQMAPGSHRLR